MDGRRLVSYRICRYPCHSGAGIKHGLELSDDFKGPQLELQWTFGKNMLPNP